MAAVPLVAARRGAAGMAKSLRRAVALDMDGTTLSSSHALTQRTIEAIRMVSSAGVQVIIATGRPSLSLQPYVDQLALPQEVPTVCFNGACAMLMGHREAPRTLFSEGLAPPVARQVIAWCRSIGWCASYCRASGPALAAPANPEQEQLLAKFERLEGTRQERVADLEEVLASSEPPLKVVAMVHDPDAAAAAAREALPEEVVHIIAAEMHVEFLSPAVNKGNTLARLCREVLDIRLEEVVAFGDNHNDLEMLKLVGEGVAMANAKEAVKAAADRECRWTNDEEGVARDLAALIDNGTLVRFSKGAPFEGARL